MIMTEEKSIIDRVKEQISDKELEKLRKQAQIFSEIIEDNYSIPFGKREVVIWKDRHSKDIESLVRNGISVIWKGIYSGEEYTVSCREEEIFNMLVDEYLNNNKLVISAQFQKRAQKAKLFKIFINRTTNRFA